MFDSEAFSLFLASVRRIYTDEQMLNELRSCATRQGRAPTIRAFAADPETQVHPQTVIERFGSWNVATRKAGLVPRRYVTREELLGLLRGLGDELGKTPTWHDIDTHRGAFPSKSLFGKVFGSLPHALKDAGFDVPVGEDRLQLTV